MARLNIDAPLVEHLLEDGRIRSGAGGSVAGWRNTRIEIEIAVRIGKQPTPRRERVTVEPTLGMTTLPAESFV